MIQSEKDFKNGIKTHYNCMTKTGFKKFVNPTTHQSKQTQKLYTPIKAHSYMLIIINPKYKYCIDTYTETSIEQRQREYKVHINQAIIYSFLLTHSDCAFNEGISFKSN